MIHYIYDDKGNAVPAPAKPAAEPYPHRGTFTSAYTVGDRVSATYDIRSAPRRSGVVWGVLFHEEVGGDSVAYKIKMDDTGQFETWASGYVVPLDADVAEACRDDERFQPGVVYVVRPTPDPAALVELIRKVEWSGGDDPCCPWCGRGMGWDKPGKSTHTPDCPAARVLYPTEKP